MFGGAEEEFEFFGGFERGLNEFEGLSVGGEDGGVEGEAGGEKAVHYGFFEGDYFVRNFVNFSFELLYGEFFLLVELIFAVSDFFCEFG